MVYNGETKAVLDWFKAQGFPCPEHYNPAEHVSDLISDDFSSDKDRQECSQERVRALLAHYKAKAGGSGAGPRAVGELPRGLAEKDRAGPVVQFQLLLKRAWRQVSRDKRNLKVRALLVRCDGRFCCTRVRDMGAVWKLVRVDGSGNQTRIGSLRVVHEEGHRFNSEQA